MPDFGSFRGFGDKLVQGQTPTQLGLIGSQQFAFDADAVLYFERIENNGGTLSGLEKQAVNQLIFDLKQYGIWNTISAAYPMIGSSSIAFAQNLKSASFTGSFSSGGSFTSNGFVTNGVSTMNTNFVPSNESIGVNNLCISGYTNSNIASETKYLIGASDGSNETAILPIYNNTFQGYINESIYNGSVGNVVSKGYYIAQKNNTNNILLYKDNTKLLSASNTSTTKTPVSIHLGGRNLNGTVYNITSCDIQFAHIGSGLTDTEVSNLYTAVQSFQTALNRNI